MKNLLYFLYYVFFIVRSGHDGKALLCLVAWYYLVFFDFLFLAILGLNFLSEVNLFVIIGLAILVFSFGLYYYRGINRMDEIVAKYNKKKISKLKIHLIGYCITFFPIVAFLLVIYLKVLLMKS